MGWFSREGKKDAAPAAVTPSMLASDLVRPIVEQSSPAHLAALFGAVAHPPFSPQQRQEWLAFNLYAVQTGVLAATRSEPLRQRLLREVQLPAYQGAFAAPTERAAFDELLAKRQPQYAAVVQSAADPTMKLGLAFAIAFSGAPHPAIGAVASEAFVSRARAAKDFVSAMAPHVTV